MAKFKVSLTSTITSKLERIVEAKDKFEANMVAITNAKLEDWKKEAELISVVKKLP